MLTVEQAIKHLKERASDKYENASVFTEALRVVLAEIEQLEAQHGKDTKLIQDSANEWLAMKEKLDSAIVPKFKVGDFTQLKGGNYKITKIENHSEFLVWLELGGGYLSSFSESYLAKEALAALKQEKGE